MKNYIERVTNLERTKEPYIPKKIVDDMIENLEPYFDGEDPFLTDEIKFYSEAIKDKQIDVYTLDTMTKTTQRPMDICPYCECKMHPKLDTSKDYNQFRNYYRPMNYVVFECEMCGAKSPKLYFNNSMLDKVEISKQIEDMLTNMDGEEEEE